MSDHRAGVAGSEDAVVAHDDAPAIGQVWRDLDPRGGPTFRIVDFEYVRHLMTNYAVVTDLNGKRKRRIKVDRLTRKYERVDRG